MNEQFSGNDSQSIQSEMLCSQDIQQGGNCWRKVSIFWGLDCFQHVALTFLVARGLSRRFLWGCCNLIGFSAIFIGGIFAHSPGSISTPSVHLSTWSECFVSHLVPSIDHEFLIQVWISISLCYFVPIFISPYSLPRTYKFPQVLSRVIFPSADIVEPSSHLSCFPPAIV